MHDFRETRSSAGATAVRSSPPPICVHCILPIWPLEPSVGGGGLKRCVTSSPPPISVFLCIAQMAFLGLQWRGRVLKRCVTSLNHKMAALLRPLGVQTTNGLRTINGHTTVAIPLPCARHSNLGGAFLGWLFPTFSGSNLLITNYPQSGKAQRTRQKVALGPIPP